MKRFTKLVESIESEKYFKVQSEIELVFKAENEGEAGYLADSELGSLESQSDFRISDISEITKDEYNKLILIESLNPDTNELSAEQKIQSAWNDQFNDRVPTKNERMEFYHQMRLQGFDGQVILSTIDKM